MLSKFDKYVNLIKDTKDEKDYSIYTQIIKNERIKRNQTLESMAKGICSISYLSKMENNAIKPSEEYVKALLERVDVADVRRCAEFVGEFNISDDDIKYGLMYGRSVIAEFLC